VVAGGRIETDIDESSVVGPRAEREAAVLTVERKRGPVDVAVAAQTSVCRPQHDTRTVDDRQPVKLVLENVVGASQTKYINAWQSLAYSPLGAVVSPPGEYL